MGTLRNWWSSLSVTEKRYLGAGVLGLAGIGVWGVALSHRDEEEGASPEVARAVTSAIARLGDTNPNDAADQAYWELYPQCPEWLDPNEPTHRLCVDLWLQVRDEARFQLGCDRDRPELQVYPPGSQKQVQLFRRAAKLIGVPEDWASDKGLRYILAHESSGVVGIPNYTYGWRSHEAACWPKIHQEIRDGIYSSGVMRGGKLLKSSATGLGQLLGSNVDVHYPSGRAGIGDPLEEAAGMLSYIKKRYGTPAAARACYGKAPCEVPGKPTKTFKEGY